MYHVVDPWVAIWLNHQTLDDYWKHGSINVDPARVDIPVLAIGNSKTFEIYV